MKSSPAEWELDEAEIASVTSEDLHEHRPNRWQGSKSTWRTLTEEERLLWQSMSKLRDQDLAVHLYNAFVLKKRGKNPATAQDLMIKTVRELFAAAILLKTQHFTGQRLQNVNCPLGRWTGRNLGAS